MPRLVAIDTGPLAALFDGDDERHAAAVKFFQHSADRGFVTGGVIAEAMWLLDFRLDAQLDCLRWIRRGAVDVVAENDTDWDRIAELIAKYRDLPMDYADGALVAACERLGTPLVATIDSHFEVYRFRGRQRFENVFLG